MVMFLDSIQSSDSNADFGLNVCANTNIQCGPKDDSVHPNAVCQIAGKLVCLAVLHSASVMLLHQMEVY